jgi:anaerobic selenocysteine-containing dehydrogenase
MDWKPTACVLCSINCGLQVRTEGGRILKVKGDRAHPASKGYVCEKAAKLDHYQNGKDRIDSPLRRRADGTYERVSWDVAIPEIAARLLAVRQEHGGESIFYYGGGGQGNHLGGALYGRTLLGALGSVFSSNALAQEKTGEFWVDSQLYGKARCHTTPDFEHAQVAIFLGKNPWQSHGFPRARVTLKEIARDPNRTLVVIDPRRTETADIADLHLQVRPGGDAFLLSAMVALLLQEGADADFIENHTGGIDELRAAFVDIPVSDYCTRAGVDEADVRALVGLMVAAEGVSIFEDLGIQQAPHSTLNSYLEKLLYLLTGNLGKPGGMNIHTGFGSLGGSPAVRGRTSPVTGERLITGLLPANAIPDEILTDHPDRFRALIVESANPAHSLADSPRMREAMRALEFSVVIDVAMTETAREADYVLPASSQYAKWEAAFFTLEFPRNDFHLRRPVVPARPGTLPEPEIHTRLLEAMGFLDDIDLQPLHDAAKKDLVTYAMAFVGASSNPALRALAPVVLYRTMGPLLPEGAEATAALLLLAERCARVYPDAVRRAGIEGAGPMLGLNLFQAILDSPSGLTFTVDEYSATLERLATGDGRVHLVVPEMLAELAELDVAEPSRPHNFPFILAAGERRSSTANTLYRDPAGRAGKGRGGLRVSPADAERLGLGDGDAAQLSTRRGTAAVVIEISDTLRPGHITLPNGMGLGYPGDDDVPEVTGVAPNELTRSEDRDRLAGTPWHKHVAARLEALPG